MYLCANANLCASPPALIPLSALSPQRWGVSVSLSVLFLRSSSLAHSCCNVCNPTTSPSPARCHGPCECVHVRLHEITARYAPIHLHPVAVLQLYNPDLNEWLYVETKRDCDEGQRFQRHPLLLSPSQKASECFVGTVFADQLNRVGRV